MAVGFSSTKNNISGESDSECGPYSGSQYVKYSDLLGLMGGHLDAHAHDTAS